MKQEARLDACTVKQQTYVYGGLIWIIHPRTKIKWMYIWTYVYYSPFFFHLNPYLRVWWESTWWCYSSFNKHIYICWFKHYWSYVLPILYLIISSPFSRKRLTSFIYSLQDHWFEQTKISPLYAPSVNKLSYNNVESFF